YVALPVSHVTSLLSCVGGSGDSRSDRVACATAPGLDLLAALGGRFGPGGLAALQPRHHAAQLGADLLDTMGGLGLASSHERLTAGLVLRDPFTSEGAVLDPGEDLRHRLLGFGGDDLRTGVVVAPLGGVGNDFAHVGQATLVDEVHDELHL